MARPIDVEINVRSEIAEGAFERLGHKIVDVGLSLVSAGIDAGIQAIGNSIELASDKAEAASKVNVLFADSADAIHAASQTAATSVGLSSGAYLEAAGNLGNLLKNFDLSSEAAAGMSQDMIQLAADVGSFNNADPSEVIEAMGAAMRGESEPMRRFGVMIDEAGIKAKAMELGLTDATGAVTSSGRAQAIYALMLEQTSAAQGDFARTSDGLANSQRINAAKMEDAWTRVGEALQPIAEAILPILVDGMLWIIGIIEDVVVAITSWVDQNRPLLDTLSDLADLVLGVLGQAFGWFMGIVQELGYRLGGLIGLVLDIIGALVDLGDAIIRVLQGDFAGAAEAAQRGLDRIGSFGENVLRVMGDAGQKARDEAEAAAATVETTTTQTTGGILDAMSAFYDDSAAQAQQGAQDTVKGASMGILDSMSLLVGASDELGQTIPDGLEDGKRDAVDIAAETPGEIADALRSRRDAWKDALDQLKTDMSDSMDAAAEIAELKSKLAGRRIAEGLESTDPIVRAQAQETVRLIEERIADLEGIAYEAGTDTGEALADGLRKKFGSVSTAAEQLAGKVRGALELNSPARSGPWSYNGGPIEWMRRNAERMVGAMSDTFAQARIVPPDLVAATSGATVAGARAAGPTVIIQTGVGDPVAIGREVRLALDAYARASGTEAGG